MNYQQQGKIYIRCHQPPLVLFPFFLSENPYEVLMLQEFNIYFSEIFAECLQALVNNLLLN